MQTSGPEHRVPDCRCRSALDALRFDQPINYYRSTLTLVTPDGTSMLRVRLSAQPNSLYSAIGRLIPGSYELQQWHAHAAKGEILAAMIPFTVTR
jgi:hypothetical protein